MMGDDCSQFGTGFLEGTYHDLMTMDDDTFETQFPAYYPAPAHAATGNGTGESFKKGSAGPRFKPELDIVFSSPNQSGADVGDSTGPSFPAESPSTPAMAQVTGVASSQNQPDAGAANRTGEGLQAVQSWHGMPQLISSVASSQVESKKSKMLVQRKKEQKLSDAGNGNGTGESFQAVPSVWDQVCMVYLTQLASSQKQSDAVTSNGTRDSFNASPVVPKQTGETSSQKQSHASTLNSTSESFRPVPSRTPPAPKLTELASTQRNGCHGQIPIVKGALKVREGMTGFNWKQFPKGPVELTFEEIFKTQSPPHPAPAHAATGNGTGDSFQKASAAAPFTPKLTGLASSQKNKCQRQFPVVESEFERKEKRMMRNRVSADQSRVKKKVHLQDLEAEVISLRNENALLREKKRNHEDLEAEVISLRNENALLREKKRKHEELEAEVKYLRDKFARESSSCSFGPDE